MQADIEANGTVEALHAQLDDLRRQLDEAQQVVDAIRAHAVDAFLVSDDRGDHVYTLETADRPYRRLVESMQEGAATLSAEGTLLFCNRRFGELVGAQTSELMGQRVEARIVESQRAEFSEFLRRAARDVCRGEFEVVRHDGSAFPAEVTASVFDDGRANRVCLIVGDLSERRRYEALRRVQVALERSEAEFRMLFEAAGVANALVDSRTGAFLRANRRYCEIVGYGERALGSLTIGDMTHPDDRERVVAALASSGRAETPDAAFEQRYVRRDGEIIWVHTTATPMITVAGEPARILVSVIDVSERKAAEAALRISERRLAAQKSALELAVGGAPLGEVLARVAEAARLLAGEGAGSALFNANPECTELLFAVASGLSDAYMDAVARLPIGPDHPGCSRAAYTGEPVVVEDVLAAPEWAAMGALADAHGIRASWSFPIVSHGNRVLGTLVVLHAAPRLPAAHERDSLALLAQTAALVIEGHRAVDALHQSESRFRLLADSVPIAIWVTDAAGDIQFVNREYERFFGVTEDKVRSGGWQPLVHPDDARAYVEAFRAAMGARGAFHARARVRRADGAWRWIESRGVPRLSATGEFLGVVGSSLDITEQVEAEASLRSADRRKDEFLATLAHELRNPLAPMRTGLEVIRRAAPDSSGYRSSLDMMQRQVTYMVRMIDDLLDVSRITTGKLRLAMQPLDLVAVVKTAVEAVTPLARSLDVRLELSLPSAPSIVEGDETRLHQVIGNLLHNAVKFSDGGGCVRVAMERADGDVVVRVRDDGIGIPPEHLDRVFELFGQAPRGAAFGRQEGLGIGLHLAKRLVEMHGGTIRARSEGRNRGTELTVRLPASAEPRDRDCPARSDGETAGPVLRALVVDDNVDAANSLALLLELEGHVVAKAYDGQQAVLVAGDFRPTLVILDLWMPRMDGYEVARELRARFGSGVQIWALSGLGQEEDVRRALASGFDAYLVKPVDGNDLHRRISTLARVDA